MDPVRIMKIVGLSLTIIGSIITSIASTQQMDNTIAQKVSEVATKFASVAEESV